MAEKTKRYYWLKLKKDFFKRHDIRIIESMPNGKDYILFYLKLLCESVDHDGNLRFSDQIPYNEEMLSTITNTNVDIVRSAINIFTQLDMMTVMDDGTYFMRQVEELMGSETYWAKKKREQKLKELSDGFSYITVLSNEKIALPNGETRFIDEKRYGGNGKKAYERAMGKCEICGSDDNLCIHHNNGYSNELDDLIVVCRSCHRKLETGEIVGNFPMIVQPMSNECQTCPTKSKRKSKSKSKNDISSSILADEFEELWSMYPKGRKQGKKKAFDAYKKARQGGASFEEVKHGLESYIKYIRAEKIETQYTKQGATFFGQRAWDSDNYDWTTTRTQITEDDELDEIL